MTWTVVRFAFLVLLVTALVIAFRWLGADAMESAAQAANRMAIPPGASGVVAFVALYALAVAALIPGSILALAAGLAYGWKLGLLVAVVAANLGAGFSFLIARSFGRSLVERLLRDRAPRLEEQADALGFEVILGLRLLAVVPFVNYAAGLSAVRFRDFVLASMLGLSPSTFGFVLLGANLDPVSPIFWIAAALILALAAVPILYRRRAGRPIEPLARPKKRSSRKK